MSKSLSAISLFKKPKKKLKSDPNEIILLEIGEVWNSWYPKLFGSKREALSRKFGSLARKEKRTQQFPRENTQFDTKKIRACVVRNLTVAPKELRKNYWKLWNLKFTCIWIKECTTITISDGIIDVPIHSSSGRVDIMPTNRAISFKSDIF